MPFDFSSEEQPSVYKPEGRRLRPSFKHEEELKQKALEAKAKLESLSGRPPEDSELVMAKLEFEEANLDYEIFDLTHDQTGALKREASGADLAGLFEAKMREQAEAEPHVAPPEQITPVFLINMGELDRLNKASLGFGNKALIAMAERLTNTVSSALEEEAKMYNIKPEELFKVFRADSNSFFVHFEKAIPKVKADAIKEMVSMEAGASWKNGEEDPFVKASIESPPVIADYVSMEETVFEMPPSLRTSGKAETYVVGALRDTLFTMQEANKIVSRTERIRTLVNEGELDAARDLYDKFLKKSLAGAYVQETGPSAAPVAIETFEQFQTYLLSLEAERDLHGAAPLWEQAFDKALGDLRERYKGDEKYARQLLSFVSKKAKEEYEVESNARLSSRPPGAPLPAAVVEAGFKAPTSYEATEGLKAFATFRNEAGFERDNLEKAKAQNAAPEEMARLEIHARIAGKRLKREQVLRDGATGLELRGPLFKRLEAALADSSKRVGMVSVDMGFLKYFDQVGGRATGDLAILTAASIMQRVKDKFSSQGVEISTHRLGGDEFGLAVIGNTDMSVEDFRKTISNVQAELGIEALNTGGIPPQEGAKPGYYQTKLSFGVGSYLYEDRAASEAEDEKYGLADRLPESATHENKRAEHLLAVADKVVEFQKAAGRLKLMLELKADILKLEAPGGDAETLARSQAQLKQLMDFSDKAMFGDKGRKKLKQWEAELANGKTPEEMDHVIHEFVWEAMEEAFEEERKEKKDLESFVEYAVRIEYLQSRVRELESRLGSVGESGERKKHQIATLKEKLSSAEEDLEKVRSLRGSL